MLASGNIWFGTWDSYSAVQLLEQAKADGTLMKLRMENPEMEARARSMDDDGFRIGSSIYQRAENVAIINVEGSLVSSYAWYNSYFGLVSYEEIRDAMEMAVEDDNIEKVVLNIATGGGAVMGLDDTAKFIRLVDEKFKPVYAHTSSAAHSAGYWLATATRKISSSEMGSTGSIGVIVTLANYKGALAQAGIEYHYFRSGKFKALGQTGEEVTSDVKDEFMGKVETLFGFFERQVTSRRPNAVQHRNAWVEGKTFFGEEARSIGLVDEIVSFDSYLAKLFQSGNNNFAMSTDNNGLNLKEANIMKLKSLTAEQQAKLASGVPLQQLGLSDEDLATAQAEIDALQAEENEQETDETEGGEESADGNEGESEASEEEVEETGDEEGGEEAADNAIVTQLMADNKALTKASARLEVKLEAAEEQIAQMTTDAEGQAQLMDSLMAIAKAATNKLQVAVGATATSFENVNAETLIKAPEEANSTFEKTFKVGQTSVTADGGRNDQDSLKQPRNKIKKKTV